MPNPFTTGGATPNGATNPTNPVNGLYPTTLRSKTNFPMFKQVLNTTRFGLITPLTAFECVPSDDIALNTDRRLDSYTLASPLMSQLRWHHAHFAVPKSAIYYNTYAKLFVNPKKGDDADPDNCRALFKFQSYFNWLKVGVTSSASTVPRHVKALFIALLFNALNPGEFLPYILRVCPVKSTIFFRASNELTQVFDSVVLPEASQTWSLKVVENGVTTIYGYVFGPGLDNKQEFTRFLDDLLFFSASVTELREFSDDYKYMDSIFSGISSFVSTNLGSAVFSDESVNIEHVIAYQLGCAQFFTNSDVDYIYTAELYRQNMESLISTIGANMTYFVWNGIRIFYDWCSSYYINSTLFEPPTSSKCVYALAFFANLFSLNRSLKYGDMVNGGYIEPLAVGDASAPVSGSAFGSLSVSAVDTTISILREKYLNLVNSVSSTIQSYSSAVFGVIPDVLPPEPKFMSHSIDSVNDIVNVNTAESQGTQMANLSSRSSRREYVSHFNQETIIVSCDWFDVIASYRSNVSPFANKKDRFDYFIPQMQNIGMQPVYTAYIDSLRGADSTTFDLIYSYLPNDYEYKQMVSEASGAFATGYLPSWAFIDLKEISNSHIDPYAIRYYPTQFDEFYKSLVSLGANRFHFICSTVFHYNASRPMEFNPGILMRS